MVPNLYAIVVLFTNADRRAKGWVVVDVVARAIKSLAYSENVIWPSRPTTTRVKTAVSSV